MDIRSKYLLIILQFIVPCICHSQQRLPFNTRDSFNSKSRPIFQSYFDHSKQTDRGRQITAPFKFINNPAVRTFRQNFSSLDTCATYAYRLKIGNAGSTDVVNEIYSTHTYEMLLTGKTNLSNNQYDALLVKLDRNGRILWSGNYGENSASEEFFRARQTSDGGIITIGSYTISPSDGWVLVCKMNNNGGLQWTKRLKGTITNSLFTGTDIIELSDGSFAFTGDDGQSVIYGIISNTGTLLWSKTVLPGQTAKALRIIEDYNGIFIATTGTDAGWYVSNIFKVSAADGSILWNKKFGGSAQNANYIFHKVEIINLRPRITGLVSENGGPYLFFRATVNTGGNIELLEKYNVPGTASPLTAKSSTTPWSQTMAFSNGNSPDIHLLKNTTESPPEWSYTFNNSGTTSLASMERTFDGGFVIACNFSDDILLIKTDSAGLSPSCGGAPINIQATRLTPAIPTIALSSSDLILQENNSPIPSGNLLMDTVYTCKQLYCPGQPIEDSCLTSFYKAYRSYEFAEIITASSESSDDHVLFSGLTRSTPYSADAERSFVIKTNKKGDLVASKIFNLAQDNVPYYQKKLIDGNTLITGYYFASNTDYGIYLLKLDNNLNIIWSKTYRVAESQWGFSDMTESVTGEIFIYLYYYNFPQLSDRLVALKFDNSGNIQWQQSYKPNYDFSLISGNGNMVADGNYLYFNTLQLETDNKWKTLVVKIDKNSGNVIWGNRYKYQTISTPFNYGMQLRNNHLYLSGIIPVTNSDDAAAYLKLNVDGSIANFVTHIKPGNTFRHIFTTTQNGDLVSSYNTVDYNTNPATVSDFFVRLDSNFNIRFSKKTPAKNFSTIRKVIETESGEIFASGYNLYDDSYNADLLIKKYNYDGTLGACASDTFEFAENFPLLTVVPQPMIRTNEAVLPITMHSISSEPFSLQQLTIFCSSIANCDTLWMEGPQNICDSSNVQIYHARKNPGCNAFVQWSVNSNQVVIKEKSDSVFKVKFLQNGVYKIKNKLFTGCAWLEDSLTIDVMFSPRNLDLGPDSSICPNNTLTLNAHSGFTSYQWQDGSGDSTLHAVSPGTYWVETEDACHTIFRDTIIINPSAPIPFDIGPDLTKCNSDSVHITAPTGFINYSWSPNYNINSTTGQSVILFPSTDTMYIAAAEKTPGCFAYDSVHVTVNNSPPINLGADTSFCAGNSVSLNAGSGFQKYLWSSGQSTQSISVNTAGTYSVIATDLNNCLSKDTLKVLKVFNNPTVHLPKDSLLCTGSTKSLNAGAGLASYLWNTGATTNSISVNNTGTYWVNVIDNNGCKGTDTTKITRLLALPSAFLPADTFLCSYSTLQLTPLRSYASYSWSNGSIQKNISINQAGTYWLRVADNFNCTGTDTIIINPKQCLEGFFVPNAFTPNKDGKNDIFRPLLFGVVKNLDFTIYNRWGQKVYETSKTYEGWDGKVSGKDADTNVFVWTCEYQFEGQDKKFAKGTVVLIR